MFSLSQLFHLLSSPSCPCCIQVSVGVIRGGFGSGPGAGTVSGEHGVRVGTSCLLSSKPTCPAPNTNIACHNEQQQPPPPLPGILMNWTLFSNPLICLLPLPPPTSAGLFPSCSHPGCSQAAGRESERNYLLCAC